MEPDKSGKNRRHHVHDGDVVLLLIRSPDKTGYVYSEPLSSSIEKGELTISSQPKSQQMSDQDTGFINDFALFRIIHGSLPNDDYKELELLDENKPEVLTFVYGSTVKLCHYVSDRYLTVSNKKDVNLESEDKGEMSLFRIVPPHKEKGWGKSLMMNDGIKLESILHKGTEIKFRHNPDEICYRPALGGDGTVFSVEPYSCMDKLSNPQTIKRGSIVMLAGIKIDGYLSAKGSLVSRKLPTESQDKGTVSLRKWRKGFFNTQPFSGDTFFQLEKEKAEMFKGNDFAFENKCRIKHLLTQQYISLRNGKIVVQEGEGEVFSIGAVDTRPKKVLQFSDQVIFYFCNGAKSDKQKCLCFDVEKEKVSDIQLALGEEKTPFKLIKVDDDTVADVYEVMGMTLTLEKFLTTEVMIRNCSRIIELMKGLQASFNCSLNKTRLANMLRTLKMIDVLAVILNKINQSCEESQEKQDLCSSICTSLLLYVKNGSLKSLHYLTQKKLLLDVLLKLVGSKCGAENVLITFFNGYPKADSSLLQGYLLPLIQVVSRPDPSVQESDEVNLLGTLAFNGKWMNWEVQEKTAEKVSEMFGSYISAQELIEFLKSNGRDIEKSLSSANSSFSTFIKVDENEKFQFDSPASVNSFDDVNQAIEKLNVNDFNTDYHAIHIQALIAIAFLIDFGVINNCNKVLHILIAVLNGKQPTDDCDRHHDPVALKMKALALMSLKSLLRWNVNTSIKKLCQDFNCLRKKCETASLNDNNDNSDGIELQEVIVERDGFPSSLKSELPPRLMSELVGKSELRKELTGVVQSRLRWYCSQNSIFDIDKVVCKQLCSSLIVLVNHDDAELRLRSIELLYSIYSLEETILTESAERAYFTYEESEVHSSMKQLATMTDEEQLFYQVLKREITSQNIGKLQSKLDELSVNCILIEYDETEPNVVNQEAAYSCGLFDLLLDIVLEPKVSSDDKINEEILKSCFIVLQKIARKNERVQSKLFTSLYDFLEVDTAVSEMIHLLNEMFSNNCKQLYKKLSLADISHIFHIAVTSSNTEHYELTVTLRIIIENTSVATPIQEHIAQLIEDYKEHTLKQLLENSKLAAKLKDSASHNITPRLLLNITDLMASCAIGECQHAESISSRIYEINELLSIVTSEAITNNDWKLPFIRVLTWTYLFTERDSASDCLNLASNKNFWVLLEKIDKSIKDMQKQIKNTKKKQLLKVMKKSYWNTYLLTKSDDKILADICEKLLFVIEGVIPLLSGFCREISVHAYKDQLTPGQINTLKDLGQALMKFMEEDYHTHSILEQLNCCHFVENFKQLGIELTEASLHSDLMPHQNEVEVAINKKFQAFIVKYSKAYFFDQTSDDMQKSLSIPKEPSFEKLLELFTDTNPSDEPKILKLISILRTLVEKQKELGLHCLERTNLEKMTIKTLQLICGIVYKKISRINSKRTTSKPDEFQKQYHIIVQPIQKILLCEENGFVKMLLDLLQHPINDITFQVLACFNVLLYPGNHEAQQKLAICINQHDENFTLCISQILTEAHLSLADSKKSMYQSPQLKSLASSTRIASPIMDSDVDGEIMQEEAYTSHFIDYRITMALDVLIWLCDGQQKEIQDALIGNKRNGPNIVSQVAFLLLAIVEDLNDAKIIIAQKAVQALIEMCTGSDSNQSIACKGQAIVSINAILEADFKFQDKKFQQLKCSSMELLEILLEEIDERSPKLAHVIVKQLHVSHVLKGMLESWKLFSKGKFIEESRNSLFRAYHSLKRIASYKNESINTLVEYEKSSLGTSKFKNLFGESVKDAKRMWEHCESWSTSVEINYKIQNDKEILTRAFFPYDPHNHLNEDDKKTILLHIKRGTPQEKLFDLLKWTDAIKSDKKSKKNLSSAFRWLFKFSTGRHFALFWLTLLMNLIVLFSLSAPITSNFASGVCEDNGLYNETCNSTSPMYFQPIYPPEAPVWYYPLLYILGSIHALLSLWMALEYFFRNRKNIRIEMLLITQFKYKLVKGLLRRKKLYQVVNRIHQLLCRGPIRNKRPKPAEYFQIFLFSFQPIYRILFVLFSIAGLATHGYFYCGCLIYLFLRNDVMLYIVRALKRSAFQLITVFLLCVVIIYIYAVFSFALLQNYFSNTKDEFCNTLFECFVTVSRLGLLTTLGTALDIRPSSDYQPNFSLLGIRAFYDIVFYIVVTTLGLNIVIAILVDSFSDMRQENDEVENDNKTKCLICNIEKDKFERQNKSFQKHHDEDHNVWNYIHYILYLDSLHANDYNAIEKYVSSQVANEPSPRSITFFPLDKAKSLPNYQV